MIPSRLSCLWTGALLALAGFGPARLAAQSNLYFIVKDVSYVQKQAGTVSYVSATPFQFGALCNLASTLTTPGGSAATTMAYNAGDNAYELASNFASQSLLDESYPSGTYTITISGSYVSMGIPTDEFPAIPSITNGYWNSSGQLQLDPTLDNILNLATFPSFATVGAASEVLLYIEDSGGTKVVDTYWTTPTDTGAPPSYTIPKGTLAANATYTAYLDYSTFSTKDGTTIANSEVEVEFGQYTTFTLLTTPPPTNSITAAAQPQSQTVASGATAVLHFKVTATPAATYQWYFGGAPLLGATTATLVVAEAGSANAGAYYCVATNSAGSVTSATATLGVSATTNIGHLVNISCRAQVGTGANILITGFALGGSGTAGPEELLVRASGPALANLGVPAFLPDPDLELFSGSDQISANQGWDGANTIVAAAASVGAFGWSNPSSHDSALVSTLAAGPYTAQVAGESGDTGVALAEIYDDPPGGVFSLARPRLVNISARVQVGTSANILIAGFVIGGSTSETVLIRATGPSLAAFGVAGTLADPKLQLMDTGGNLLYSNTVWGGDADVMAAAARVGAFPWAAASADSAILVTLAPGAYTAQVSGASGDTGVALVEVYEIP